VEERLGKKKMTEYPAWMYAGTILGIADIQPHANRTKQPHTPHTPHTSRDINEQDTCEEDEPKQKTMRAFGTQRLITVKKARTTPKSKSPGKEIKQKKRRSRTSTPQPEQEEEQQQQTTQGIPPSVFISAVSGASYTLPPPLTRAEYAEIDRQRYLEKHPRRTSTTKALPKMRMRGPSYDRNSSEEPKMTTLGVVNEGTSANEPPVLTPAQQQTKQLAQWLLDGYRKCQSTIGEVALESTGQQNTGAYEMIIRQLTGQIDKTRKKPKKNQGKKKKTNFNMMDEDAAERFLDHHLELIDHGQTEQARAWALQCPAMLRSQVVQLIDERNRA